MNKKQKTNFQIRSSRINWKMENGNWKLGFTLIELLIVISIIGILTGISVFALAGSRESARDTKRKTDLEQIRSALEIYKSDCHKYPTAVVFNAVAVGGSLKGDPSAANCTGNVNTYIQAMPADPSGGSRYKYCSNATNTTYDLTTYLEDSTATATPSCVGGCSGGTCRYQVKNP